jgi:hypothetical protein
MMSPDNLFVRALAQDVTNQLKEGARPVICAALGIRSEPRGLLRNDFPPEINNTRGGKEKLLAVCREIREKVAPKDLEHFCLAVEAWSSASDAPEEIVAMVMDGTIRIQNLPVRWRHELVMFNYISYPEFGEPQKWFGSLRFHRDKEGMVARVEDPVWYNLDSGEMDCGGMYAEFFDGV